jgi:hypothetical protein
MEPLKLSSSNPSEIIRLCKQIAHFSACLGLDVKTELFPKTTGCASAGSWPLRTAGCEVRSSCGKSTSAFLSIYGYWHEATRFRVLRIYDHDNTKTAIDFLREVQDHFPFAIQKSRPITVLRSDHSSLGIFPISASRTGTYLQGAPR